MKFAAKTEYACLALLELAARHDRAEPVQIQKLADQHDIPSRFLVQILLQLKSAGLVVSTRGAAGGYRLARAPQQITLGEVVAVIEGPDSAGSDGLRDSPAKAALRQVWRDAGEAARTQLASVTLADLARRAMIRTETMYHI